MRFLAPLVALLLVPAVHATALGSYVFEDGEAYAGHQARPGLTILNYTYAGHAYLEIQTPVPALVALNVSTANGTQLRVVATYGSDDAVLAALLDSQAEAASSLNTLAVGLVGLADQLNETAHLLRQVVEASTRDQATTNGSAQTLRTVNGTLSLLASEVGNASRQVAELASDVRQTSAREHQELAHTFEEQTARSKPKTANQLFDPIWFVFGALVLVGALIAWRRRTTPPPTPQTFIDLDVKSEPAKPRRRRKAPATPVEAPPAHSPQDVEAALRRTLGLDAKPPGGSA